MSSYGKESPISVLGGFSLGLMEDLKNIQTSLSFKGVHLADFTYTEEKGVMFTRQLMKIDTLQTLISAEYHKIKQLDQKNKLPNEEEISPMLQFEVIITHLVLWEMLRQAYNKSISQPEAEGNFSILVAYTDKKNEILVENMYVFTGYVGESDFNSSVMETAPTSVLQQAKEAGLVDQNKELYPLGTAVLPQGFEFNFTWAEYLEFLD